MAYIPISCIRIRKVTLSIKENAWDEDPIDCLAHRKITAKNCIVTMHGVGYMALAHKIIVTHCN